MICRSATKRQQLVRHIAALFVAGAILSPADAPTVQAATLSFDNNLVTDGPSDGAGTWDTGTNWWNGSFNNAWTTGDSAIFGYNGPGGAVTLSAPTMVGSLTFNFFTGTYTLGSAGQAITLNNGITRNPSTGTVAFASNVILGGDQTWTNNASNQYSVKGGISLGSNTLTIDGIGNTDLGDNTANTISGAGGSIVKNGAGRLILSASGTVPVHTFGGSLTVNNGQVAFQDSTFFANINTNLNGGVLAGRSGSGRTWSGLGSGANQIRITGGESGFSGEGTTGSTFQIGSALSTLTWGDTNFNPSVLVLGAVNANNNGIGSLNNTIDLNGATRTITSTQVTNGAAGSGFTLSGAITNSGAAAGLIKTGVGNLILVGNNTYDGATSIQGGSITLSGANGRISATSSLALSNGGTLRMVNTNAENTVDRLNSSAITVNGGGGITWDNTAGANSFAEELGAVTVNSGPFNVVLGIDQNSSGSQTLTLGGLNRPGASNTSAVTFSALTTGPQASGSKNMIAVTGATQTPANQIIGPWATTGTAVTAQSDYAVYDAAGFVVPANLGSTSQSGWTTAANSYALTTGSTETLTDNRTITALRFYGSASDLALSTFRLETSGLLFSGASNKTVSASAGGALTTASGGGNLFVTTGQSANIHSINAPITNNGGDVTLVKSGPGTLVLNGLNTYTGDTVINAGTLRIGTNATPNGASLNGGNYAGNIAIAAGATLNVQTNVNQTLSGVISGDGSLFKSYNGTLILTGANTYTGKTTIAPLTATSAGTLVVSSFNSVVGGTASSSLGAPKTVANGTIDFGSGSAQAAAQITYTGSGETTDRVINFQFNGTANRTIDASGTGLLKFTSTPTANATATNSIILQGSGSGEFVGGLPFAFTNLTKTGTGTWTLSNASGHTGPLSIQGGVFVANHPNAMGGISSGTTVVGDVAGANNQLQLTGHAYAQEAIALQAKPSSAAPSHILHTGGTTTGLGNITLNAGGASTHYMIESAAGSLQLSGNIIGGSGTPAAVNLHLRGAGNGSISGNIDGANALDLSLTKAGAGTWTLTGGNAYDGPTTVSAGKLAIGTATNPSGTINNSAVTINGPTANFAYNSISNYSNTLTFTQGTLSGTNWNGNLSGLTIDTNKTIAPGNSPGTANTTTQIWAGGGTYQWEINNATGTLGGDPGWDLLNLTGALTQTATSGNKFTIDITGLNLSNVSGAVSNWNPAGNFTYIIASAAGGITGFDPAGFTINTVNFISGGNSSPGTWSILQGNGSNGGTVNDILLSYTASMGSPTFLFTDTTAVTLNVMQNGSGVSAAKTIQNNGGASGNATLSSVSNLSVTGSLTGIAASGTSNLTLAPTSTATPGTTTGTLSVTPDGGANDVSVTINVGTASFNSGNSQILGTARILSTAASNINYPAPNWSSNTAGLTASGGGPAALATTATILMYNNTTGSSVTPETVSMQWRTRTTAEANPSNPNAVLSDIVNLTGMYSGAENAASGTGAFVLQMNYLQSTLDGLGLNENAIATSGELRLGWNNGGNWQTAVLGNSTGSPAPQFVGVTDWNSYYLANSAVDDGTDLALFLGRYGVDPSSGTGGAVWAVVNHNSEFAVIPEPSTLVLGGFALLGLAGVGLRRRRLAQQQA